MDDAMLGCATGLTRLELCDIAAIDGSCFGRMRRLRELALDSVSGLSPACLAPLAGSLRLLDVDGSASVDDQGVGALTGLRLLELSGCEGVSVDAVRRLPMLRHLDVIMFPGDVLEDGASDFEDMKRMVDGWRRVKGREGEAALRAEMPQLENVHIILVGWDGVLQ